jgi:hypothetical protein
MSGLGSYLTRRMYAKLKAARSVIKSPITRKIEYISEALFFIGV